MRRRWIVPALLCLPAAALAWGGWAVISLHDLPDHAVAGQPLELAFTVLSHGKAPVDGLSPRIEARSGLRTARAEAAPGKTKGQYRASLALPRSGEWTITLHSDYGREKLTLLPIDVIEAGAAAPRPLPEPERGKRLFVAKGCVGCHTHGDVEARPAVKVAPELTGRRFETAYLARFLADPSIKPPTAEYADVRMPNLGLKEREIAALSAFLNAERRAGR